MVTALAFMPADKILQGISGGQHDNARGISGLSNILTELGLAIQPNCLWNMDESVSFEQKTTEGCS